MSGMSSVVFPVAFTATSGMAANSGRNALYFWGMSMRSSTTPMNATECIVMRAARSLIRSNWKPRKVLKHMASRMPPVNPATIDMPPDLSHFRPVRLVHVPASDAEAFQARYQEVREHERGEEGYDGDGEVV